ncbi:hypothetical protein [Dactylosporangium salmoneum]|uniref:hypothetical protein n=1 Tax=Dactylosporangium salmoneum TaxID=53361 RepID=UPI0031D2B1FF
MTGLAKRSRTSNRSRWLGVVVAGRGADLIEDAVVVRDADCGAEKVLRFLKLRPVCLVDHRCRMRYIDVTSGPAHADPLVTLLSHKPRPLAA